MDDLRRRTRGLFAFRRGILALDTAPACLTARFRLASIKPSARAVDRYLAMVLSTPKKLSPPVRSGEMAVQLEAPFVVW